MKQEDVRDNLKALSAYLFESSGPDFMYEAVEQAIKLLGRRDMPKLTLLQVARMVNKKKPGAWKSMSPDERQLLTDMLNQERERAQADAYFDSFKPKKRKR